MGVGEKSNDQMIAFVGKNGRCYIPWNERASGQAGRAQK